MSSTANCPVDQPTPQLHVQAPPTVQASPLIQPPHVPIAQAPPTVQARPTDQAPPTVQAPSPVEAPDQQHLTSDESTAPVSWLILFSSYFHVHMRSSMYAHVEFVYVAKIL